jgi:3-hydroxyisobutyrate dehydrogenase-like beta-hydroxyacid dehydrogenase
MRVGFIGLGSQGGPMARRIVEAGYETTLWARRPASLEPYADTAARTAATPAELAAASDLIGVCVIADADVEQVLTGPDGVFAGLRPGSVVAVHSTIHPDTVRRLAGQAKALGADLIDAPVSGGQPAAAAGNLLVMVGGEEKVVDFCRPVFATYGDPVLHMGPLGSGEVTKLLNNVLFTANLATAGALLELGAGLGVDPVTLAGSMRSGGSYALDRIAAAGGTVDRIAQHAGALLAKDVRLAGEIAESAGLAPGFAVTAAQQTLARMG